MAFLAFVFLITTFAPSVFSGSYFMTVPQSIIRGTKYEVTVEILNTTGVDVLVELRDRYYDGNARRYNYRILKTARNTFSKGVKGNLSMPIEDTFNCRTCQLYFRGRGGLQFERTLYVNVQKRLVSVLIQTDKSIYKPEQRVRYRALAVYPDLQVYTGSLDIVIMDPNGNKIKVQRGQSSPSGIIEGYLDLSDQPPFGDWAIQVSVQETSDKEEQSFTVAVYDLPRFEVQVELPSYKLLKDHDLSGTIRARYTYGQPVKGMVELYVGPDRDANDCGKMPQSVQTVFDIDGEAKFSVPRSDIQRVVSLYNKANVRVTAFVKEAATGVRLNGSNVVTYHSNEFVVKFLDSTPNVFKPGLPYVVFIQVSTPDEMPPPQDASSFVSVYAYAQYQVKIDDGNFYGMSTFTGNYPLPGRNISLPSNGVLATELEIPENATSITINVHYKGQRTGKTVSKTYSESNNFLQLSLESTKLKAGDQARFRLQATEPLQSVFYVVLSRGSVIASGNVKGYGAQDRTFIVPVTSDFAPTAHLLAYYDRESSEIIADSIAFNVDGIFSNKVTVSYNVDKSEPNKEVDVIVTADPNSTLCLLAVDQSVLLLKSGNDITGKKVKDAVSKFDSSKKPSDSSYALSYSSKSVAEVFQQTGLQVITDVKMTSPRIPRVPVPDYYDRNEYAFRQPTTTAYPRKKEDQRDDEQNSNSLKSVDHIRKVFPEAWLWKSITMSSSGRETIKTTVPDTITSWVTSAFATNAISGLGVAPTTANLTVFRPFFVSLNYPSTLKRNEQAVVQVTVFNYLSTDVTVRVAMKQSRNYRSLHVASDGTQTGLLGGHEEVISVKSEDQGSVYFPIEATKIGTADIEVTAQSAVAADGVRRQILIEPEGAPVSFNYPIFVTLNQSSQQYTDRLDLALPSDFVPGSETTRVKVSGDLIGPSLNNIESLLALPTGCGEQSMVKFAPDLYIAKYLRSSGQWSDYWHQRITSLLESGYQRQLSYQRLDGGFSAFGDSDEAGSTWLTAFVSRTFNEARDYIYIDPVLLTRALDWLLDRQNEDGSFAEIGRVLDQNTQGSKHGPALTAYVLLALLQNKDIAPVKDCVNPYACTRARKLQNATSDAITNLENSLPSISDPFSLAVVSYALGEAKSRLFSQAFNKLFTQAKSDGGLTYWSANTKSSVTVPYNSRYIRWRPHNPQARPIDILITSYALLAYASSGRIAEGIPSLHWLTKQRNSKGGFTSTQDTTVALHALATYAANTITASTNMRVQTTGDNNEILNFHVTQGNALLLQTKQFNTSPRELQLQMSGTGFVLTEIDHSFNIKTELTTPSFDVSTVFLDDDLDSFNLMICTKWLWDRKTGMVVQEIGIPSGFIPDLSSLGKVVGMKRSERRGSTVAVYFDEIGKTSTCYSILMTRSGKVAKSEPSFIRTYDYYEPLDKSTVFYLPTKLQDSTICDVCEECCK